MTAPATRRSRFGHWTLRRRVGRWFVALSTLLVLAFAALLAALINFNGKGNEIIDRWQPAYTLSQNVLSDLVNQETGLRGYVIGKQDAFLTPYTTYREQQTRDERQLRGLLHGRADLLADLAAFDRAAGTWRATVAAPYIARIKAGDPTVSTPEADLASKRRFDAVRSAGRTLSGAVARAGEDAKSRRSGALIFCIVTACVAAALTLGSKYLLWRGLRHSVLEPIEELAVQTRDVAAGEIDKRIVESGPPEIAGLGSDVDTMRARIADQLARVDRQRQALAERSDELARSNADLEQFAYVASHDLSEPLRKVANFCQLLERQYAPQLDDKAKQYIHFAVDGAKRMQVLISDLLAFSRVGRTTESFEAVDTGWALERALTNLDDRVNAGAAEIVRGPLPTISGDPTLITALFQNLLGNALKYASPERRPCVRVQAEQQGEEWLFTVADNGIGIDPQYAERIFTIFQRLHLRDAYGGTGIGLALCRKIVEFHRGRIWLADSAPGRGATFAFVIPAHAAPRGTDVTGPAHEPATPASR